MRTKCSKYHSMVKTKASQLKRFALKMGGASIAFENAILASIVESLASTYAASHSKQTHNTSRTSQKRIKGTRNRKMRVSPNNYYTLKKLELLRQLVKVNEEKLQVSEKFICFIAIDFISFS